MATQLYTTVLDHTSDAGFRAWGLELDTALIAAGIVATADTGQINFVTVNRPGTNTAAGYRIYRFNDTMQATAPIFLKLEFGTATGANNPQMWVTAGTGSNGSGTITGTASTRTTLLENSNVASTVTNYVTNVCVSEGYCGFAFKRGAGAGNVGKGGCAICRSVDSAGAPNADGMTVFTATVSTNPPQAQAVSFLTSTAYAVSTAFCMIGMGVTSSLVGGTAQVYKHYTITPRMRPNPFLLTVVLAEISGNTQFDSASVGAVSHNYLSVGNCFTAASVNGANNTHGLAMLWE